MYCSPAARLARQRATCDDAFAATCPARRTRTMQPRRRSATSSRRSRGRQPSPSCRQPRSISPSTRHPSLQPRSPQASRPHPRPALLALPRLQYPSHPPSPHQHVVQPGAARPAPAPARGPVLKLRPPPPGRPEDPDGVAARVGPRHHVQERRLPRQEGQGRRRRRRQAAQGQARPGRQGPESRGQPVRRAGLLLVAVVLPSRC